MALQYTTPTALTRATKPFSIKAGLGFEDIAINFLQARFWPIDKLRQFGNRKSVYGYSQRTKARLHSDSRRALIRADRAAGWL